MIVKRGRIGVLLALVLTFGLMVGCQCGATTATPSPGTTTASETPPVSTSPALESSPVSTTPSMTMVLYENTEHGFSFQYPEGWTEFTHSGATSFYIQYKNPESDFSVEISVDYQAGEMSLADAVIIFKSYMEGMSQFEISSEGDVTIAQGIPGYEMVGQGDEGGGNLTKFRGVVLVRGRQIFWVGVSVDPGQFDEYKQLADTFIDSFRLLAAYTYEPPAPSPGGTYTSAEYGFSITYPAGWSDVTTGQYSEILDLRADAGIPELMVRTWTGAASTAEAALTLQQVYQENYPDYEFLSEGELTLDDGTPAYGFVFNATMQGYFLTAKCVIVMRGQDVFCMMGFGSPSTFAQDELVLDEIIGSFHLE
jgi:hypothetical protein